MSDDAPVLGAWVNARPMKSADKSEDAPPILLYFPETVLNTGPVWVEGEWSPHGYLHTHLGTGWKTPFGYLGDPIAWAPLPKTPEDMS